MAAEAEAPGRAGHVRWRRRLLFLVLAAGVILISLHVLGGRVTGMSAAVIGGLVLLGFIIVRLPHLRRHFARPGGGGGGGGSLNFPNQVAARNRRKRFSLFRRKSGGGSSGGGSRSGGGGSRSGSRRGLPKLFRGRGKGRGAGTGTASRSGGSGSRPGSRRGLPKLFRGRGRGGASSRGSGSGSGSRRRLFSGRRASGGTGSHRKAGGGSGASSRRRLFGGRRSSGGTGRRSSGGGSGSRRRLFGGRRTSGGTAGGKRPGSRWRRLTAGRRASGTGRRSAGAGGRTAGGTRTRRRWFAPWRRSSGTGRKTSGTGGGRRTSPAGGVPSWRRPLARARWNRAHPRTGPAGGRSRWWHPAQRAWWRLRGAPSGSPGRMRRGLHRVIGTPAQRAGRKAARGLRRARGRVLRRRAAVNPYAHRGTYARRWHAGRNPGWRARIARRWRIRRGAHKGLGIGRVTLRARLARASAHFSRPVMAQHFRGIRRRLSLGRWLRNRRSPRPLLAGHRAGPGLQRFRNSPPGRWLTALDRRRADRWLARQRGRAPGAVRVPAPPRPAQPAPRGASSGASLNGSRPRGGNRMADTAAMADEIRGMGGHDFADPQDVHDYVANVHQLVDAMQENLAARADQLDETGVHPAYPEAVREAAMAMSGIADQLEGVTAGGVMRGPGG